MSTEAVISHAFVLPDRHFHEWLAVLRPYLAAFERVAVIRSPAGNNLNFFRNVTAVEAPMTWWQDSALTHIRQFYPQVVLVDVIEAAHPAQLEPILRRRIQSQDRYGQTDPDPQHLFSRFVLEWAVAWRPMTVLGRYNARPAAGPLRASLDLQTRAAADVLCAADGEVAALLPADARAGLRSRIRIESTVEGERFITTYEGVRQPQVQPGSQVRCGQLLAQAQDERLRIFVQNPPTGGIDLQHMANAVNPRDYLYIPELRMRPIVDGLRVRELPSVKSKVISTIYSWQLLQPLEHHGRAIEKTGLDGSWLKLRTPAGAPGYSAAHYLQATTLREGSEVFVGVNPVGVNLDIAHPLGRPHPPRLGEMGWVRFGYNVSNRVGSEDIAAALGRYLPLIAAYRQAGYQVVITTSHQTYGEARSQYWPWAQMTDAKWRTLTARFAEMMHAIAAQWAPRGLIAAWQIWNEPDAPLGTPASVPMSVQNYTRMFAETHRAIRSADSDVKIITAGFTSGPGRGGSYARQLVDGLPPDALPDGIAFHPYGRGISDHPIYEPFGHIDESVWAYSRILPSKPLWITEWGVLDRPHDDVAHVAHYARSFIHYLKARYSSKIAAIIWYAWAQGMHNAYGLVDARDNLRPPLSDVFLVR